MVHILVIVFEHIAKYCEHKRNNYCCLFLLKMFPANSVVFAVGLLSFFFFKKHN